MRASLGRGVGILGTGNVGTGNVGIGNEERVFYLNHIRHIRTH